jgi:LmbE family N-acetylglucosaminyl deacetylase
VWPGRAGYLTGNSSEIESVEDERGIVALDQVLRELSTPFTLLCVAARPSDLDEGTLAYYRKKVGARVVVMFVTRGEGAPSLRRPELDHELGVIRTREALASARIIGADVFFLNLRDFGHSSSADEAIRVWGHGEALKRMVRAFRSIRPDVVITNHRADTGDGIQRAVARLSREAFDRAASATPPPEPGVEPWQARRLFERLDWTAGSISQDVIRVELTELDRLRGATYAQLGLRARKCLVSWNGDRATLSPDRERSYYRMAHSAAPAVAQEERLLGSLIDGLKLPENVARSTEPPRIAGRAIDALVNRDQVIEALTEKLIEKRAEGGAEALHARYGVEFFRVLQFTHALERALAVAIGFEMDVVLSDSLVVPRQKISAKATLRNHSARTYPVVFRTPASISSEDRGPHKESEVVQALPGASVSREVEYEIPADARRTLPIADHLREEEYYGFGTTLPGSQSAEPFGNALICFADVGLGQASISLAALTRYNVARNVEISTVPFAMVTDWSASRDVEFPVRLRNHITGPVNGALWIVQLAAADDNYEPMHLSFSREDEEVEIALKLKLPLAKPPLPPDVLLEFRRERPQSATTDGRASTDAPAEVLGSVRIPVKSIDAQVAKETRVGFISGRDAWLVDALTQLGVQHQEIGPRTLNRTVHGNAAEPSQTVESCRDLSGYTAIIVDELAYLSHRQLIADNRCLLRYVRQGGKLIVLAQQADDLALLLSRSQFAPFPITLSTTTVGVNASVRILEPEHATMSLPNRLTGKDFEGWAGELSLNVPRQWSNDYTPLLESAEAGLENRKGLLLVARHGEGLVVYTALSLRRQFRAINPGALRVLANLVSLMDASAKPVNRN